MNIDYIQRLNSGSDLEAEIHFINIFRAHEKQLYEKILPLCKSEEFAKDIIQDVFLKLWLNRDILEDIQDAKAYLYTMAQNRVFNLFKRAAIDKKVKTAIWNRSLAFSPVTEEQVLRKEFEGLLAKAIQELPPQRKAVYLLHKDGYSYNEISESLGISKHTIKNQIYAAVKQIKKIFSENSTLMISILLTLSTFLS